MSPNKTNVRRANNKSTTIFFVGKNNFSLLSVFSQPHENLAFQKTLFVQSLSYDSLLNFFWASVTFIQTLPLPHLTLNFFLAHIKSIGYFFTFKIFFYIYLLWFYLEIVVLWRVLDALWCGYLFLEKPLFLIKLCYA